MKKTVLLLLVLLLVCSCDLINFGPPETLKDMPAAKDSTVKKEKTTAKNEVVSPTLSAPVSTESVAKDVEKVEDKTEEANVKTEEEKKLEFKTVVEAIGLAFDLELVSPDTIKVKCPETVTQQQVEDFINFAISNKPFYFKDCTQSYKSGEITVKFGYELTTDDIAVYINLFKETFAEFVAYINPEPVEEKSKELEAPVIVEHTEIYTENTEETEKPDLEKKSVTGIIILILCICLTVPATLFFVIYLKRKVD